MLKRTLLLSFPLALLFQISNAQEVAPSPDTYYETRAREDAAYEMALQEDAEDEEDFWASQEAYEKALKKRDKKAYRAYMRGKREAYREHASRCGSHCHHGHHFEYRATYYYSDYYRRPARSGGIGVRVASPRIRIGF